jgi:aryl-alcohol dehydrogenase-like predicted oxidoreductase
MKYSKLGRTGLDCSRLGFGTWQIGGGRWKGVGQDDGIKLLRHALDSGVNIFDAAIVYGQYRGGCGEYHSHALELLGEALDGARRKQAFICLKVGQVDEFSHRAIYSPTRVVGDLQRAFKELRTDYVDICLIHAPSLQQVRDGHALAIAQTVQAMGAARFIGYSFEAEPEHAKLALTQDIDVVMLQYNLIDQQCAETFELASERGVGVLVGGPFKRGYLSGRYDRAEDLPLEDGYWEWNLRYCREKVATTLRRAMELRAEAGGVRELRSKALAHILVHPSATVAVVGHRATDEVDDNARIVNEVVGT